MWYIIPKYYANMTLGMLKLKLGKNFIQLGKGNY